MQVSDLYVSFRVEQPRRINYPPNSSSFLLKLMLSWTFRLFARGQKSLKIKILYSSPQGNLVRDSCPLNYQNGVQKYLQT